MFPCDPPCCVIGAFPSRVLWAGLGTPSLLCHRTTSSCLEVSPQRERRWVSLTLCSGVANNPSRLKMITGLKKISSAFQVMLGCTTWAKMNGSLSNTVTQRGQGKSLILLSTLKVYVPVDYVSGKWHTHPACESEHTAQTVHDIVLCVSGCGTQRAPALMGRCSCLEGAPTTCCLIKEL